MTRFYPYPFFSDSWFVVLPVGRPLWWEDGSVTYSAIADWSGHRRPIIIHYRLIWDCVPSSSPLTTRRDYGGGILTRLHTGYQPLSVPQEWFCFIKLHTCDAISHLVEAISSKPLSSCYHKIQSFVSIDILERSKQIKGNKAWALGSLEELYQQQWELFILEVQIAGRISVQKIK
jgi:hypothetical protein